MQRISLATYSRQTQCVHVLLKGTGLAKPRLVAKHGLLLGEATPSQWTEHTICVT
jgi:hypothetical protein